MTAYVTTLQCGEGIAIGVVGFVILWCLVQNSGIYDLDITRAFAVERRTRTAFLFFPKSINGDLRWLSRQTWTQEYINVPGGLGFEGWFDVAWG